MKIIRKVYCGDKYEGLYQLILRENEYMWQYQYGTIEKEETIFDYSCLCVSDDRWTMPMHHHRIGRFLPFKEEDLV